jgi:hypothetical protein
MTQVHPCDFKMTGYHRCAIHTNHHYAVGTQGLLERKGVVQFTLLPEEDYSSN